MTSIERLIVGIGGDPWAAVYLAAIGFAIPKFHFLMGVEDSLLISAILFLGVLVALRVVPALLRHTLPFSPEAQRIWGARRNLSKEYDSYAWQKLFWIGLGVLLFAVGNGGGLRNGELAIMLFCLIGGGIGLLIWRNVRSTESVQLSQGENT
jgi:hypothetical protein